MGEKVVEAYNVIQKLTTTNKQLEATNKKYLENIFNYFKQEGLSSGYDISKAERYATEKTKNVLNIKIFGPRKNNNVAILPLPTLYHMCHKSTVFSHR